ncbi:hypothetical protein [Paenibacillus sp. YIM B09110]|uniref:hypothetical protein n=1 Tax=Paenibacillus sp. YIM B09110 TaxID=3126102 RepID=UPI00301D1876
MPRKKTDKPPKPPKQPRITAEQRRDWRNLPTRDWNVMTFLAFFTDRNAELYGAETYVPMRNWSFEQGVLKRAIAAHRPDVLREACEAAFESYRPTRDYPLLTAGFAVSYRINALIPAIMARRADDERRTAELQADGETDYGALGALL